MKTIKINGTELKFVGDGELTYEEICNIANPPQQSVTYCRGPKDKPEGVSHHGQSVQVVDGMMSENYSNHVIFEDGSEYWTSEEGELCSNGTGALKVCPVCKDIWFYCECKKHNGELPESSNGWVC